MNFQGIRSVAEHLLCFAIPLYALLFLWAAPHHSVFVLLWTVPVWLLVAIDLLSPKEIRCQSYELPRGLLDSFLLTLAALQVLNILLLLFWVAELNWSTTADIVVGLSTLFAIKIVIGTSSAFSCIVLAHELIHRKQWHMKLIGRFLLCLVCYEHFFTEHIRGHHRNVGTSKDPATARFGESYNSYWKRTVPAQFKNAWRLESRRLRISTMWTPAILAHRVFQGVVFQCILVLSIYCYFGEVVVLVFLLQALAAVRKLEAINYFEHWGLVRSQGSIHSTDSWDSDSWFTLHTMVGLSRHSNHHLNSSKPFFELQLEYQSPKLPYGYFAMIFFTVFFNKRFQEMATSELERRQLGCFQN